jgi:hypothetical protein
MSAVTTLAFRSLSRLYRSNDRDAVSAGDRSLATWRGGFDASEFGLLEASRTLDDAFALDALGRGDVVDLGAVLKGGLSWATPTSFKRAGDVNTEERGVGE